MTKPIQKTRLDNELTVVLREMHHAPVTSFWIWYRVGSRNEDLAEPVSKVTGGSGNSGKGSLITYSGGARG